MSDQSDPQARIESDLKDAMKAREKERTGTLRMLLAALKNRRIETGENLSDQEFTAVVKKAVKQRQDAAEQYRKGDRPELADKEEREIDLLEVYLPEQVDEAAIRQTVASYIDGEGLSGMPAMGQVMKEMTAHFEGAADGKLLSGIVRELLNR